MHSLSTYFDTLNCNVCVFGIQLHLECVETCGDTTLLFNEHVWVILLDVSSVTCSTHVAIAYLAYSVTRMPFQT